MNRRDFSKNLLAAIAGAGLVYVGVKVKPPSYHRGITTFDNSISWQYFRGELPLKIKSNELNDTESLINKLKLYAEGRPVKNIHFGLMNDDFATDNITVMLYF